MIDRIELQKIKEKEESKSVSVEPSNPPQRNHAVDYEYLSKKVESIRAQLQKNAYEVSPDKIIQGLEKFLSSK